MAKNKIPERPTPPKAHAPPERILDLETLLSEEKKLELRETARRKVLARDIADAEEAYLKAQMSAVDKETHPEIFVEMREIRLNLALYADRVTLDGHAFYADELYTVPKPVYDVLKECERMTARHDEEIRSGDTNDNFYRRSRAMSVNMRTGAATVGGQPVRF